MSPRSRHVAQCASTTKAGKPCAAPAMRRTSPPSCPFHSPRARAWQEAGGRASRDRKSLPPDAIALDADPDEAIDRLVNLVLTGKLDPKAGRTAISGIRAAHRLRRREQPVEAPARRVAIVTESGVSVIGAATYAERDEIATAVRCGATPVGVTVVRLMMPPSGPLPAFPEFHHDAEPALEVAAAADVSDEDLTDDPSLPHGQRVRRARLRARRWQEEHRVVDPTDPKDPANTTLSEAVWWARDVRSRYSRGPSRTTFDVFNVFRR